MRWKGQEGVRTMIGTWFYIKNMDLPTHRLANSRQQTNTHIKHGDRIEIKEVPWQVIHMYQILFEGLKMPSSLLGPGDEL